MLHRRTRSLLLGLVAIVVVSVPALAQDSEITIVNRSDWTITHLFLSPVDSSEWGPDQLGENVIEPGTVFTLTDVECDVYDIMIIDEDGDECILEAEELCNDEAKWVLTNEELLGCQASS